MRPVLIIEDTKESREALASLLSQNGYDVTEAANGGEALDILRGGLRPGVILLDLSMPGVDGFEFRFKQLADPAIASIPTFIISGAFDAGRASAALRTHGAFTKPIEPIALIATLNRLCG